MRFTVARRWGAVLAGLTLSMLVLSVPVPARAAVNPAIQVRPTGIVKADANGNLEPGVQMRVDQVAQLSFDWDASDPSIGSGDSFEVDYGPTFASRVPNQSYPISYQGVVVGTCLVGATSVTCTLNDEYVRQRAVAPQVRGTTSVLLLAMQSTTDETVPVRVNGTPVPVDLPGTGGILPRSTATFVPATFTKISTPLAESSRQVSWSITFGIPYVNQARAAAGLAPVPTDGTTVSTISLSDILGPGQAVPTSLNLVRVVSTDPATRQLVASTTPGTLVPGHSIAHQVVDPASRSAQVTVTAPFVANANYTVSYVSPIVDADGNQQNAVVGVRYTNTARLDGTTVSASGERVLAESFGITVSYQPGFGGFRVVKTLGGDGITQVPAQTTFPVTGSYTLPAGTTADDYPGWTPPGTLNPGRTGGTFSYRVKLGGSAPWGGSLPRGTQVSLSEDPAGAEPTVTGVEWASPVWRLGRTTTSTFTIGDQQMTSLQLDNTAARASGTFMVAKTVSGEDGAGQARTYTFSYSCGAVRGTLQVPGDGTPVSAGVQIPLNVSCTVTEDQASAQVPGYQLTPPAPQTQAITSRTTPTAFSFSNQYTPVTPAPSVTPTITITPSPTTTTTITPSPAPVTTITPSPAPVPVLADTGSDASLAGAAVGLGLVTGGGLLLRRGRRG